MECMQVRIYRNTSSVNMIISFNDFLPIIQTTLMAFMINDGCQMKEHRGWYSKIKIWMIHHIPWNLSIAWIIFKILETDNQQKAVMS